MGIAPNNILALQAGIEKFKRNGWAVIGLMGFKESEIRLALSFFQQQRITAEHVRHCQYNEGTKLEPLPHNGVLKITSR